MLAVLTLVIMAVVAYAYWKEGLLTAVTMCVNVFVAGLVAFNFFEPLADLLDSVLADTFLHGYEDGFCLVLLFGLALGGLRWATNSLANSDLDYHPLLARAGTVLFSLVTGYLVAGFLVCVLETLPWHQNFLYFELTSDTEGGAATIRRVLPPDHVWLGLMFRAGAVPLANNLDEEVDESESDAFDRYVTFDKYGTFELRYARYRRYNDNPESPQKYFGELDKQIHRPRQ